MRDFLRGNLTLTPSPLKGLHRGSTTGKEATMGAERKQQSEAPGNSGNAEHSLTLQHFNRSARTPI